MFERSLLNLLLTHGTETAYDSAGGATDVNVAASSSHTDGKDVTSLPAVVILGTDVVVDEDVASASVTARCTKRAAGTLTRSIGIKRMRQSYDQ